MNAVGYVRISKATESGLSLASQRTTVTDEIEGRGWELVELVEDADESGDDDARPGLNRALTLIADGDAEALVVAKLDRLSRSSIYTGQLLEWFERADAALVAMDLSVDTSTPSGKAMATVLAAMGQWEREAIGLRTKEALAAKQARGEPRGRPTVKPKLKQRIERQRRLGWTLSRIASQLEDDGIATVRGGAKWRPSSVASVLGYRAKRPPRRADFPSLDGRRHGNNRRKATA